MSDDRLHGIQQNTDSVVKKTRIVKIRIGFEMCSFFLTQEEEFHNALSPFPSNASLRLEFSHTCLFNSSRHALSFILHPHNPPPFEGGD